jgi:nitrate reductase NapD
MLNICGCLVHTMPGATEAVIAAIDATEGGEVHAHENGRIVITVEDTATTNASDQIMAIHQIPGVLNVTLTYHHFEEPDETVDAASPIHQ